MVTTGLEFLTVFSNVYNIALAVIMAILIEKLIIPGKKGMFETNNILMGFFRIYVGT